MFGRRAIRVVLALVAIAFFAAPLALRATGMRGEAFENRRLADAPTPSQGWDAFQQATQYLIDHMPLRAQAVRLNSRVWTDVFGTDPLYARDDALSEDRALPFAGTAVRTGDLLARADADGTGPVSARAGRAGWFYLDEEFEHACDTSRDRAVLQRWGRVLQAIRASGRPAVMLVPPAKASVYPEYLPDEYPFDHCALEGKERLWSLLSEEGPELGVIELRGELLRLKADAGDKLFQRTDSHWSTLGALTLVKAALEAIGDGIRLEPSEIAYRGSVPYVGDLTVVGGRAEHARRMEYAIERAPGAPRVPGRTLLIGDSFAGKWLRLFRPYFAHLRETNFAREGPEGAIKAIRRSDTVVIESMELLWKSDAYTRDLLRQLRWTPL